MSNYSNLKFEVEYDERVNPDLFMISTEGSDEVYKMVINTWDDPYCVYYAGGNAPNDKEEFEKNCLSIFQANILNIFNNWRIYNE